MTTGSRAVVFKAWIPTDHPGGLVRQEVGVILWIWKATQESVTEAGSSGNLDRSMLGGMLF